MSQRVAADAVENMSVPTEDPNAPSGPEQELLRFGSFGVGITFGRPSLFRWTKSNRHEVVLTDRRILIVRKPSIARAIFSRKRGGIDLEVPLADVVKTERLSFLGRPVVWLEWRKGAGTREVSIEGAFGRGADVVRFQDLLEALLAAPPSGP